MGKVRTRKKLNLGWRTQRKQKPVAVRESQKFPLCQGEAQSGEITRQEDSLQKESALEIKNRLSAFKQG
jgi:hypothetical protein